jgi:hypothetical protein
VGLAPGPGGVVMAGRPEPAPIPASDSLADGDLMFRHTFLCRLPEPSDREAIMQMGEGLDACMGAMGCWGVRDPRRIASMAAALAEDVEALAAYALTLARQGTDPTTRPGARPLHAAASQWAGKLTQLAVEIRAAVSSARGVA